MVDASFRTSQRRSRNGAKVSGREPDRSVQVNSGLASARYLVELVESS